MKRSPGKALYLCWLLIGLVSCAPSGRPSPNVILIVSDDQGCGDLAFTGNTVLQTPHLDQLRAEGMLLDRFQVAPVCAPTRAGLMTGRNHLRTGVRGVIEGREFMVEEEITIAELLRPAGYRTALFGKWHLGEHFPWLPHGQGFDEYIGFRQGSSEYFDVVLDNRGTPYPTSGYLTDVFTDLAIDFIEKNRERPFFLYVPYNAPHGPLEVPDSYVEPYSALPERTAKVYGMMASLDENIGRLMAHLEETGLADNTLVLYFSDNGPLFGNASNPDERYNCRLRGQKYDVYEGGIRAPLIARWPGRISPNTTSSELTSHLDIVPTVLDLAEIPLPDTLHIDGISLRSLLENEQPVPDDRMVYMTYPGEQVKGKVDGPYPGGAAFSGQYKMVDGVELYDLDTDPGEQNNVAEAHPDILEAMDGAYRSFWTSATADRHPYPRPHFGHDEENPVRFSSHFADLEGGLQFQFRDDPPAYRSLGVHHDWVGRWDAEDGQATWRLQSVRPSPYRVSLRLRCGLGNEGVLLQVEAGGKALVHPLTGCEREAPWRTQEIGVIELEAGEIDVRIKRQAGRASKSLGVDEVIIERMEPIKEDTF